MDGLAIVLRTPVETRNAFTDRHAPVTGENVTKSPLHIRRAGALDCRALAALLNEIIAIGGTTAKVEFGH